MQPRILFLGATACVLPLLPLVAGAASQAAYANAWPVSMQASAAVTTQALTLEQAVELAINANPELRATAQNVAIADGAREQAGLWRNPELSVSREGAQRTDRTQTVQISQPLELGGKRSARVAVADFDRSMAVTGLSAKTAALRADVTAAYFEALTAQERVELAQGSLELAQKASAAAKRRVTAGKISPVEETKSNVAAATARLELVQANGNLLTTKRRLAALWGYTEELKQPLVPPTTDLPALPSLNALLGKLDTTPQLQRARQQIQRDEAQVSLERAQRIPDVAVTLGTKKDYSLGRSQTIVGLSIPLPLFNRNQGNLLSALRRVDQSKAQFDVERLQLQQALAEAYQRTKVSEEQIVTMRSEVLPAAQSALDAAVTGFELGKFNFLDVLDAQRTLFQTRAQYLSALSEHYRSMADIQRYVVLSDVGQPVHADGKTNQ